jgi:isopentenyldiphosphate isomerase
MHAMGAGDELVEEVDGEGAVLRVVTRAEMRAGRLRHRCVFIAVRATDGRLLVHRRSDAKDVWPGYWDIAAGGVAGVGEEATEAARRELAEELGVAAELTHLGTGRYDDADVHLVGDVFEARHDGPFHFADGEVSEARFVTPSELDELLAQQRVCPDSVALVLPLVRPSPGGPTR